MTQYLAIVAALTYCCGDDPPWCGTPPYPGRPPRHITDETPVEISPAVTLVNNLYALTIGGLIGLTVVTHPEEAFSLKYGPFILIPTFRVLAGLYYNNVLAKVKPKKK